MMENKIIKGGLYFCAETGYYVLSKENIKQDNNISINYFNATSIDGMVDKYVDYTCKISAFKLVEDPVIYDLYGLPLPSEKPQKDKLEQAKKIISQCKAKIKEMESKYKELNDEKNGLTDMLSESPCNYIHITRHQIELQAQEQILKAEFYDTIKKLSNE